MTVHRSPRDRKRRLWPAIAAVVGLVHIGLFMAAGLGRGVVAPDSPPVIDLTLFRLTPPPPPPPPTPARVSGGGAPAAPSRVHTPPPPKQPTPRELPAPPVQAPEPVLAVGASNTASPTAGLGQGGQGTGTGAGQGEGDGPGSGGYPPMILRRASQAEILAMVPPQARAARRSGQADVRCVIQSDTTLVCDRIVRETPAGFGFGEAARVIATRYWRFRPPLDAAGRPIAGQSVVVIIEFGRQGGR